METLPLVVGAMMGVDVSAAVILSFAGNFERNLVQYQCDDGTDPFAVEYINAAPNFLAVIPVGPDRQKQLFVAVLAASGVKYVSGQYEWWTKGSDATYTDLTIQTFAPITCSEISETP
jgi:membrane-bound inhibitor of C-type lysozyme